MQLIIDIQNESVAEKVIQYLKTLQDKGVKIVDNTIKQQNEKEMIDDKYIQEHWREMGMNTHSADLDDDERLYDAAVRFYSEKYSD